MNKFIKSDLYRYAGNVSLKSFFYCYRKEAGFRFSVAFRLINSRGGGKTFRNYFMDFLSKNLLNF